MCNKHHLIECILLNLHQPRGSNTREHEKGMPNINDNTVEPRGSTIRAQLCSSICSRGSHSSAAGAHIYSTPSKPRTQPSTTRFSVYSMNSQPPPCNSGNAGGVENNSSPAAQAEHESSHATSVSGLRDRRVHRVGRYCVNACSPVVGLTLDGALGVRPMCRVVLSSVAFVVLRVLDIVGEILWSLIASCYERLSVESRVLDAHQRRRHYFCCRVRTAS